MFQAHTPFLLAGSHLLYFNSAVAFIIPFRDTGIRCSNSLPPWWQSMTSKGKKRSLLTLCLLYKGMSIAVPKAGDAGAGSQGVLCEIFPLSVGTSPVKLKGLKAALLHAGTEA